MSDKKSVGQNRKTRPEGRATEAINKYIKKLLASARNFFTLIHMIARKILGRTNQKVSEIVMDGSGLVQMPWKDSIEFINTAVKTGINCIDSSPETSNSQDRIGDTFLLPQFRRNLVLSSRARAYTQADMAARIEQSLKKLKTDQIDIFSIDNLTAENMGQALGPGGAVKALTAAKNGKKIRFLGFSTRSTEVALRMLEELVFDVALVPANYIEPDFLTSAFYAAAVQKNIGILGLEPCGSADTADPGLSIKYLAQFPTVVPVTGIKNNNDLEAWAKLLKKKDRTLSDTDRNAMAQPSPSPAAGT
jgi:predicted aldo/keto reductase-like oxidoreductase